jgi:hypothetical protein
MGLWIYFTAPVLAMQLAAVLYIRGKWNVYCAKYHHYNRHRCIFNCRFSELLERERSIATVAGDVDANNASTHEASWPASAASAATTINAR